MPWLFEGKRSRLIFNVPTRTVFSRVFLKCNAHKIKYNTHRNRRILMAEQQFIMTQKGYDEAVKHLKYLQTQKRQEIVDRITEARSHGDLSENAEYDAARNEQAANEGEIVELDYKIKNAVIIEENTDTSYVHVGSKVRVYDEEMEEEEVYEITGSTEANAMENRISNESPVGKALLRHKVNDVVKVLAPDGEYKLIIREIF